MSQTIVPAPAAVPIAPPPSRITEASSALRRSFAGSPGRLRLIALGAVVSVVISALLGAWALQMRSSALDKAAASSSHLLLLQNVQTNLVQADAAATNSFLGYGLEPEAQRLDYIASLEAASNDLALAAQHSDADAQALGEANAALTRYSGYISSARANNRQGLPVGANYLETASSLLSTGVIEKLEERVTADKAAVESAFSQGANARWLLLLAVVIGIGGLVYAQLQVTRHSHRYVNIPAAISTVGLVVVLAASAVIMSSAQSEASDVRNGPLEKATGLSDSRVAAFSAKATESLTLIARGSATADDDDWNGLITTARQELDGLAYPQASSALDDYVAGHEQVNGLDVKGNWDDAVELATATDEGSVNALFDRYADLTQDDLNTQRDAASDRLADANNQLLPTGILLLVVGLLCAAGAWWGVSLRLDEYR